MAIINIRLVVISLALTVIPAVLGAVLKEESQGQATNATSIWPDVYYEVCEGGYCKWQCTDNSDWCSVANVGPDSDHVPYGSSKWVTCTSHSECSTENDQGSMKSNQKCKSAWFGGYRSLSNLKCVDRKFKELKHQEYEERKKQEEALKKAAEERAKAESARMTMLEEKLGSGWVEDIAARLVKDGQRVAVMKFLEGVKDPAWKDQLAKASALETESWKPDENHLALARRIVKKEALRLGDKDLKLAPESLKERLYNGAKKEYMRQLEIESFNNSLPRPLESSNKPFGDSL